MAEKTIPFVITDRRKFTNDGEPREGADLSSAPRATEIKQTPSPAEAHEQASTLPIPTSGDSAPAEAQTGKIESENASNDENAGAPTQEQMDQSLRAFQATADRLDTAIRAASPGADHPPPLTFESLVQSVYMQAVLQLGGGTQEETQPQVDLLGARQSIDMLGILADKTRGNLSAQEDLILSSAVFELRLAFLEMTQALARSAASRGSGGPSSVSPAGARPGPSIVR